MKICYTIRGRFEQRRFEYVVLSMRKQKVDGIEYNVYSLESDHQFFVKDIADSDFANLELKNHIALSMVHQQDGRLCNIGKFGFYSACVKVYHFWKFILD